MSCDALLNCVASRSSNYGEKDLVEKLSILPGGASASAYSKRREIFTYTQTRKNFTFFFVQRTSKKRGKVGLEVTCEK